MKRTVIIATALALLSAPAFASSCPRHMAAIDAALAKSPQLSAAEKAEVTKLRAEGEAQHKAGQHKESMDSLSKAEKILKIN